jgi:tetratricopeptide (TPR) repeat protein
MRERTFKHFIFVVGLCAITGCATTYEIVSSPDGATVYQAVNGRKALLGVTPFSFKKSGLPEDKPFVLSFERPSYEPLDVLVSPTDEAKTKVSAMLRPGKSDGSDPQVARMREVIAAIFQVQELTFQKRTVDALALIKELERKEPGLAEIYVLKGSIYASINDTEQARAAWKQALSLDSSLDRLKVEIQKLETGSTGGSR